MVSDRNIGTSKKNMSVDSLEAEIEVVKKSGSLIRVEVPLLQHWPWDNGIPLEHGSMQPHLQKALEGRQDQGDMVDLLLVSHFVYKFIYQVI